MKSLLLSLVALTCSLTAASAQQFVELPNFTWVNDVTPDGSIVVGHGTGGAFYWDWRKDAAPTFIGGVNAVGVSDDGTWIAGHIIDPGTGAQVAARWSIATGWQNLGYLPNALSCPFRSEAYDISGDGSRVVGLSFEGCDPRAFVWTQAGGMQQLQVLNTGNNGANTISANGLEIGGFALGDVYAATPAVWDADNGNGFAFDLASAGEVVSFTGDGSTFVGGFLFGTNTRYSAALGDPVTGFTLELGSLNVDWGAFATDISEDGSVICGFDVSDGGNREAWVWKPGTGIVSLDDIVAGLGYSPIVSLDTTTAMSDDGKVIVGGGSTGPITTAGFIAEIEPQVSVWTDLGGDTNGINGRPHLSGTGTLIAGTPTTIDLEKGPSSAISVVWTSLISVPFNVAGGTMYANPYVSEILIPLNGSGEFHAAFPWFAGVPSGLSLHFQFIIQDLSRVYGFSMSNGLKATAP